MNLQQLYRSVRDRFPEVATSADREHVSNWGELGPNDAYSWFHSLANELNRQMSRSVAFETHKPLFHFISQAALACDEEARICIDVSFVENLFWGVPKSKAEPYWRELPPGLKRLYLSFHHLPPTQWQLMRSPPKKGA